MKTRLIAILVISASISCILLLLYLGSNLVYLERFAALERASIMEDVERVKDLIMKDIQEINTTNGDYSGWDDAYAFVRNRNSQFIKTNLDEAIYPKLKLNFLAFITTAGEPVYIKGYDYRTGREMPFPKNLVPYISRNGLLLAHRSTTSEICGILRLPEGLVLVASRPVLKSDYSGPIGGTLVMGRYLDEEAVLQIGRTAHLMVKVEKVGDQKPLTPGFRQALPASRSESASYTQLLENGKISGVSPLPALNGGYACIVRVEEARTIFAKGKETVRHFVLWASVVGVISGILIFYLFDKLMLSRRRSDESETRFRAVVESAAQGILLLEPDSYAILETNASFRDWIGLPDSELREKSLLQLMDAGSTSAREEIERSLLEKREVKFRHRDSSALFAEIAAKRIPFGDRMVLSLFVHDTTERRRLEEQLMFQANHDPLTGLPNRNLLNDRLSQALAAAARQQSVVAVALIDLDNFKIVNDNFGHHVGDELLVGVAERLKCCIRASDTFARIGGDEFVHITTSLRRTEDTITVAETMQNLLLEPFQIGDLSIYVTASIGIAHFPRDGVTVEQLLQKADTALYHVKAKGRNSFQFYDEEMNRVLHEHTSIAAQLRHAIERQELSLVYQPKYDPQHAVVGVEALLRWNSAELGPVLPTRFIPVAEETDLIVPIGNWVLLTAARQVCSWKAARHPELRVSVNISARQFNQPSLVETVRSVLEETGLEPELLELELTESAMMSNIENSIARMHQLKELGVSLAIDDFGTGYASLSYLSQFPLDRIKVDKSFVTALPYDRQMSAIVQTIVVLAHSLGMTVVAEGVETDEQLRFLRMLGCEEVQGFLFSPPLPPDSLVELLLRNTPAENDKASAACV